MKKDDNITVAIILCAVIVIAIAAYFIFHPASDSVTVIVIQDQSCLKCPPTNPVVSSLKDNNVTISSWNIYDYNSTEGRSAIEKYGLEKAPAIIVSANVMNYDFPKQLFAGVNLTAVNGSYVFYLNPPFRDILQDKIVGLVDIYYIIDSTCSSCYNYTIHGNVLAQDFKVVFGSALYFDVNFPLGEEFVYRYNITSVPTYVLTTDAKYYPRLTQIWPSIGTVESNGYYVFRNVTQVGLTYKNLTSGKIVTPNLTA